MTINNQENFKVKYYNQKMLMAELERQYITYMQYEKHVIKITIQILLKIKFFK